MEAGANGGGADGFGDRPRVRVAAREVSRRYGEGDSAVHALRGVSLSVIEGELTAVMGPSGSGKSTLMHILAGLDRPTAGDVWIDSTEIGKLGDTELTRLRRRHVGFIFQFFNLLPMLTAEENVVLPLRVGGERGDRQWVDELIERVGLAERREHRPSQLSGGQQQRVALARALVNKPKVLLLDEPLGALDLKLRKELQLELRNLQHEVGITFVYVTHDQEEALTMSDRIAVMNEGRVQQVADPTTLYELPRNRFVANFIGQTNVFSGIVESVSGERVTLRTRAGARIEAIAPEGEAVGTGAEAHATVRPEKIRLGGDGDNVLTVRIGQIVYLGVSTQYIAQLPEGGTLVLYQQNVHDGAGPAEVDEVTVTWDARNCRVLGG